MSLEKIINDAWENKDQVNQNSDQNLKDAINQVIADLDNGNCQVLSCSEIGDKIIQEI